ncbi:uncharacterized protein BDZ99DRAFT_552765 [Mytilinidion resinicola]|uniref:Nuclear pore complex protein Nup85 n=1 Tax=Mytilinidion resinicola TaxID=574789 RepID=A0A6A6XZ95_9PEZI|nr:uncharacterized protein BDZ99DRAFT_552765 [Mytilinidion resinicola]KAF2801719.1 hypothetical protein BDZ99DRAFT_552765 [Mytilinidion resinicola]
MAFRVPSSTPPSTPDSRRSSRHNFPSTTPAGPPPSRYIPSSTPAGPPPSSSQFGASRQPQFQKPTFKSSPPKKTTPFASSRFAVPDSTPLGSSANRGRSGFRAPGSSPPYGSDEDEEQHSDEDDVEAMRELETSDDGVDDSDNGDEGEEYGEEEEDEEMEEDEGYDGVADESQTFASRQRKYDFLTIAKGIVGPPARELTEPDEMILETEKLLGRLSESENNNNPMARSETIADVAQQLLRLWRQFSRTSFKSSVHGAGPPNTESSITKANYLVSLLLQLHYPAPPSNLGRSSMFGLSRRDAQRSSPIPKILLDWMNTYHRPDTEIGHVLREQRGYSANPGYWDAVKYSVLRGNFAATIKLLKGGRFDVAETAPIDGFGDQGYEGVQLKNINAVVSDAIALIQECPAVASDDWDVKGHDWNLFRKQVSQTISDLREFAEGDSPNRTSQQSESDPFGMSASHNNLTMQSRKAESNVPWSIYENLLVLYNQLLGSPDEILGIAVDWTEAVLGLAIWWDGDDEDGPKGSLAASRRSLARSHGTRVADVTPTSAYRQKLCSALARVIEMNDSSLSINVSSPTDVGLACIFDGNLEGLAYILQNWSVVLVTAVVEIASADNWLKPASNDDVDGFDKSDLMVLSYGRQGEKHLDKDDMLIRYAECLRRKDIVRSPNLQTTQEGWELAIQVVGRLDDENLANEFIGRMLRSLELSSRERVDKILDLCTSLGFVDQSNTVAEKYADQLRSSTRNYGDTLLYYARGHQPQKIQEVLQILVSECLVHSVSYPPVPDLDDRLKAFITSPQRTLTDLSRTDLEAAQLLSTYLSGYATVRKFYDLRDEAVNLKPGEKPSLRPMARKLAAANALMVLISSASSSIRGGLYDPAVETVIQVDVLLSLLGEALVFVNQPKRALTLPHLYALLAAIEDLQTAPSLIYKQAEECFATTLATARGADPPGSPRSRLTKSTSNLTTASSQFSLVGSSMLGEGSSGGDRSTENSGVLVKGGKSEAKRAWDWRGGFDKAAKGEDVIRLLRLGIAEEIGRAWVEE